MKRLAVWLFVVGIALIGGLLPSVKTNAGPVVGPPLIIQSSVNAVGRVWDGARPAAGASVTLTTRPFDLRPGIPLKTVTADANGRFVLQYTGKYEGRVLTARYGSKSGSVLVLPYPGPTANPQSVVIAVR